MTQCFTSERFLSERHGSLRLTRNEDSPTAPLLNTRAVGDDNGQVFVPYDALPPAFTMVATTRLKDGSILSASFVPTTAPAPNRIGLPMASSTDPGRSWRTWTAPLVENKWKFNWYRVHRDLIELADGTLLMGGYGNGTIDGVTKEYSLLFESADGGKTFSQRAALNAGSSYSTNELGFSRTSDGRLVAVMRGSETVPRPPAMPLTQTFSSDDGKTWDPVKPFVPPAGIPNNGIMPEPMLQGNGQLLLTYGRPDNNVVVSRDGTGRTWDTGEVLYSRHPGEDALRRWMGSSGNMALVARDAGSSLAFGDTCHNIWLCREYGHDNKVWTRIVDAKGPGVGKIDLTTKVHDGTVKLTGGVVVAHSRFQGQRISGAVYGSAEYRAAARLAPGQSLTITLDHSYPLNKIGLMLARGELNSAKVQVSEDGRWWSNPVAKTGVTTDFAMRYHDFRPVQAKYVRISQGAGAKLTAVTEVELSAANLLTFENDAVTSVPRDLKDTRYALVADKGAIAGYDHSRARLALQDNDQAARAQATFVNPKPAKTQFVGFGYEGYGYGSGAIWEVLGTDKAGHEVIADRLLFAPDSANNRHVIKQWDGAGWVVIGYAGPFVPNKVWMSISLDSTAQGTTVTMNGTTMGTSSARLAAVRKFTGLRVLTGAEPVDVGNMEHSYDDVVMTG